MKSSLAVIVIMFFGIAGFLSREKPLPAPIPNVQADVQEQIPLTEDIEPYFMEEVKRGETFVFVDLDEMQLTLIKDGDAIKAYKVLSIRKIGSKFDTPTGEFAALTKEVKHFSTIGHVWMPYSVQFHGNFFIHGWPYYPGGEDVPKGYSGGCVRMDTEDMKEIYDFIKVGMKIVIK